VNEDEIPGALTDLAADIIVDALATDQETYDAVMSVSTGDEKLAAAQRLARQAVAARTAPPAINVLDMPMHTLQALAAVWVIVSRDDRCHAARSDHRRQGARAVGPTRGGAQPPLAVHR
jgi:hypothetical protein